MGRADDLVTAGKKEIFLVEEKKEIRPPIPSVVRRTGGVYTYPPTPRKPNSHQNTN